TTSGRPPRPSDPRCHATRRRSLRRRPRLPLRRDAARPAERLVAVPDGFRAAYEIVLVDDGSPHHPWRVLGGLREQYPGRVVAIQLMRNYGQHNALMCGFRRSRGRFVVTMDDDLQNPPEEVPKLLDALNSRDLDLVYGSYGSKAHSGWRNLGS